MIQFRLTFYHSQGSPCERNIVDIGKEWQRAKVIISLDKSDGDMKAASITMLRDIKENVVIMTGLLENTSRKVKTVNE